MKKKITFKTYGAAKFKVDDWYTIEELEKLVEDLKAVKERQDEQLLKSLQDMGVMK